jgi:sirohydrochlorin cobaltochelatase
MPEYALIVLAHGSREGAANDAVRRLARRLGRLTGARASTAAFLQRAAPELAQAVAGLAGRGIRRIVIVPYLMMAGVHFKRDLPRMVRELAGRHPQVRIRVAKGLEGHPGLTAILEDRVREALNRSRR